MWHMFETSLKNLNCPFHQKLHAMGIETLKCAFFKLQDYLLRSRQCFPDAIQPENRKNIFFDGQMMPIGIWEPLV